MRFRCGGVYRTEDNADNWFAISDGLQIAQVYRVGIGVKSNLNKSSYYFGSQDNGLNALKQNSKNALHWGRGDGFEIKVLSNSKYVLGAIQFGSLKSMFEENDFVTVGPRFESGRNWDTPLMCFMEQRKANNTAIIGFKDVFYQSKSFFDALDKEEWENISNGVLGTDYCDDLSFAASDQNVIYVLKSPDVYKTVDKNELTLVFEELPQQAIHSLEVHPSNPDIVYLTISYFNEGEKVYRTMDGGATLGKYILVLCQMSLLMM